MMRFPAARGSTAFRVLELGGLDSQQSALNVRQTGMVRYSKEPHPYWNDASLIAYTSILSYYPIPCSIPFPRLKPRINRSFHQPPPYPPLTTSRHLQLRIQSQIQSCTRVRRLTPSSWASLWRSAGTWDDRVQIATQLTGW